eukprot:scaffold529_cov308-Pinguiococcus_pyrenoidosus.AAC.3
MLACAAVSDAEASLVAIRKIKIRIKIKIIVFTVSVIQSLLVVLVRLRLLLLRRGLLSRGFEPGRSPAGAARGSRGTASRRRPRARSRRRTACCGSPSWPLLRSRRAWASPCCPPVRRAHTETSLGRRPVDLPGPTGSPEAQLPRALNQAQELPGRSRGSAVRARSRRLPRRGTARRPPRGPAHRGRSSPRRETVRTGPATHRARRACTRRSTE